MNRILISFLLILLFLPLCYAFSGVNIGGGNGGSITNNYYNITNVTGISTIQSTNGSLIVANGTTTNISVNSSFVQLRVNGSCSSGNYIRAIGEQGNVTCQADSSGSGTVTSIVFQDGLYGGTITSAGTVGINYTQLVTSVGNYSADKTGIYNNISGKGIGNITGGGIKNYLSFWLNSTRLGNSSIYYNNTIDSYSMGTTSSANAQSSIAIGYGATAIGNSCIAIGGIESFGSVVRCVQDGDIAIGGDSTADGVAATAIGYDSKAYGLFAFALGGGKATDGFAIAGTANGTASVAIGAGAKTKATGAISIANQAQINSLGANCIGIAGNCKGIGSISIKGTDVTQTNSIVIGGVNNTQINSVMIGVTTGTPEYYFLGQGKNVSLGTNNTPVQTVYQDAGTATANYHKFTVGTTTGVTASDGLSIGLSATGEAQLRQYENMNMTFYTNNAERMRLDNNGRLLVNTTISTNTVNIVGTLNVSSTIFNSNLGSRSGYVCYNANTTALYVSNTTCAVS